MVHPNYLLKAPAANDDASLFLSCCERKHRDETKSCGLNANVSCTRRS